MRSIWKWIVNVLAIISLLLGLATAGLWGRSYWRSPGGYWTKTSGRSYRCHIGGGFIAGRVLIAWDFEQNLPSYYGMSSIDGWHFAEDPTPKDFDDEISTMGFGSKWKALGFGWGHLHKVRKLYIEDTTVLYGPGWLLSLLFFAFSGFIAIVRTRQRRRRRLLQSGKFCSVCGYDLRASPERCPECGTPNPYPPPEDTFLA